MLKKISISCYSFVLNNIVNTSGIIEIFTKNKQLLSVVDAFFFFWKEIAFKIQFMYFFLDFSGYPLKNDLGSSQCVKFM
jgi:hypothetical protein